MRRLAQTTLGPESAGLPLADYLAARFTYKTREDWAALARAGHLTLDGSAADPCAPCRPGALLRFDVPEDAPEPPADLCYSTIYSDSALLAVNKPGNLPCHPSGRYFNHTLWALLQADGLAGLRPVNRIDRETSGIVLFARTREAAADLGRQFAAHTISKRYAVFVEGDFPATLLARGYLSLDPASPVRKRRRFTAGPVPGAKPCETAFRLLARGGGICAVEAVPRTGLCHQIRATLASLGHPVVGDKLYGVDPGLFARFVAGTLTPEDRARLRLPRQALHARFLTFTHPLTRQPLTLEAPLPPDLAALLPV